MDISVEWHINCHPSKMHGSIQESQSIKRNTTDHILYVVKGPTVNKLLSGRAAKEMGLVKRIEEVNTTTGDHGRQVKILLREGAEPYAGNNAHRDPLPLLQKVKEELEKMEASGVTEGVTQPTDLCAPMEPVIKPSGQVRICVDLKRLKENIKREQFMLPTTDDILTKLLLVDTVAS